MTRPARAMAWAAPPMSFFMLRMPSAALMSGRRCRSITPLPTMTRCGPRAPAQLGQARCPVVGTTHRVDGGKVGLERGVAHPLAVTAAVARPDPARGGVQPSGSVRRRVHQVARRTLPALRRGAAPTSGDGQARWERTGRLVARELVAAQRPPQRHAFGGSSAMPRALARSRPPAAAAAGMRPWHRRRRAARRRPAPPGERRSRPAPRIPRRRRRGTAAPEPGFGAAPSDFRVVSGLAVVDPWSTARCATKVDQSLHGWNS